MDKHTFSYEDSSGTVREWDVHRLWKLAAKLPARSVPISEFQSKIDDWLLIDSKKDKHGEIVTTIPIDHFYRINKADLKYPIILMADGVFIMDGMHRLMKQWLGGKPTVTVVQFATDPVPDRITTKPHAPSSKW